MIPDPGPYQSRAGRAQRAVAALLERLGRPQDGLVIVHLAGSKGKGSTALLLEAVLSAAGLRVGTFTSPHLCRWNERFRLAGRPVSERRLNRAVERLAPEVAAQSEDPDLQPSFFDALTACALWLFAAARVDIAILETGLGGRLDATSVVRPRLTCITAIELEHQAKLGNTLAAIAAEKAGIVKPGVPLVCGPLAAEALKVIETHANQLGAPLLRAGREYRLQVEPLGQARYAARLRYAGQELELRPGPLGRAAALNATLATLCADRLGALPTPQRLDRALRRARLPGRCEVLSRDPWLVADACHTVGSAQVLRELLDQLPPRRHHWLLSFSTDKDPAEICRVLLGHGDHVTLTAAEPSRSQPPHAVAERLRRNWPALGLAVTEQPHRALGKALTLAQAERALLCATGSVYMAGFSRGFFADRVAEDADR